MLESNVRHCSNAKKKRMELIKVCFIIRSFSSALYYMQSLFQTFFYFKNSKHGRNEKMKRTLRKVQLSFGRKDDNLRAIFASGTRQNTLKPYLEETNRLLEGTCAHC